MQEPNIFLKVLSAEEVICFYPLKIISWEKSVSSRFRMFLNRKLLFSAFFWSIKIFNEFLIKKIY